MRALLKSFQTKGPPLEAHVHSQKNSQRLENYTQMALSIFQPAAFK